MAFAFQHRAGVRFSSTYTKFAESCVFNKQSPPPFKAADARVGATSTKDTWQVCRVPLATIHRATRQQRQAHLRQLWYGRRPRPRAALRTAFASNGSRSLYARQRWRINPVAVAAYAVTLLVLTSITAVHARGLDGHAHVYAALRYLINTRLRLLP